MGPQVENAACFFILLAVAHGAHLINTLAVILGKHTLTSSKRRQKDWRQNNTYIFPIFTNKERKKLWALSKKLWVLKKGFNFLRIKSLTKI